MLQGKRVFISYARADGETAATALRERLLAAHVSVWQDLVALESGRDWWSQIEEAIRAASLHHFILIVTPGALRSQVVRQEIRLARQEGKQVHLVRGAGVTDLGDVPRWMGHVLDLERPEHVNVLLTALKSDGHGKRAPMMAPEPPPDLVARPMEFEALKAELLNNVGDAAVGITAALRGAGGYGKTTLAKALAHDPDIQEAFFDGVLWVELGETATGLLTKLLNLTAALTGKRPPFDSIDAAAVALGEALGDRRILLVIDDAWKAADLRPFLHGGPNTVRLITTRMDRVLPQNCYRKPVDAMSGGEAFELLSAGLTQSNRSGRKELQRLATRLSGWAQLLKLTNGFLRNRTQRGESLLSAIASVEQRLDAKGLVAFDARDEVERTRAVGRSIEVSLDLLGRNWRRRFVELAVFPEAEDIPVEIAASYWAKTASLNEHEAEDGLSELFDVSLLQSLDLHRRTFRLHDTIRHYLQTSYRSELAFFHGKLLEVLCESSRDKDSKLAQLYDVRFQLHHLHGAGQRLELDRLLTDPAWISRKFEVTGGVHALVDDYDRYANPLQPVHSLIGRCLRLASGILSRDRNQLFPQLYGRLVGIPAATDFAMSCRNNAPQQAMFERFPALTQPGSEIDRFDQHEGGIRALLMLPDGRLASGSDDASVRIWDVPSGTCSATLEHSAGVRAIALMTDGSLASCCYDGSIYLWDVAAGLEVGRLKGHRSQVNCIVALPDGRIASGSHDKTVRIWDLASRQEVRCLEGHTAKVTSLTTLPDGGLASGSGDKTILLWDPETATVRRRLHGHGSAINALAVLPDGLLASGSDDCTVRFWDTASGAYLAELEGHEKGINALVAMPTGRLVTASDDRTIRIWDLARKVELYRLEGHARSVVALCALRGGGLASGSGDRTIRLWDATLHASHAPSVERDKNRTLALLPDGRVASATLDTIRLWNPISGRQTAEYLEEWCFVNVVAGLSDGRIASGESRSIRIWRASSGLRDMELWGHQDEIAAILQLPDGRLASGSRDHSVRLWSLATGEQVGQLTGHTGGVHGLAMLRSGQLASASRDGTIRVWDTTACAEVARLNMSSKWVQSLVALRDGRLASASKTSVELWSTKLDGTAIRVGEGKWINALAALPDGNLAGTLSDKTVRIWEASTGAEITRLELDAVGGDLVATPDGRLVACDERGQLHWLEPAKSWQSVAS